MIVKTSSFLGVSFRKINGIWRDVVFHHVLLDPFNPPVIHCLRREDVRVVFAANLRFTKKGQMVFTEGPFEPPYLIGMTFTRWKVMPHHAQSTKTHVIGNQRLFVEFPTWPGAYFGSKPVDPNKKDHMHPPKAFKVTAASALSGLEFNHITP